MQRYPLMTNNISKDDLEELIQFLRGEPILTMSKRVRQFEEEWSRWLGVRYSVFVNSGASSNLVAMSILKQLAESGEVIVPPLTWVSDIASVIQTGFTPVFAEINPRTLSLDTDAVLEKITPRTRAVFMTHAQGFHGLTDKLLATLEKKNIPLIEDTCEAHGATFKGRKIGSFGLMSNFSFYYAHHMTTVEGGMLCTNDEEIYQMACLFRSHGRVREAGSDEYRQKYIDAHPDLNPDFIFAYPAYNFRPTEINAFLGSLQLKKLDSHNRVRQENLKTFLEHLDSDVFQTDFQVEGSCNYAFPLILKDADEALLDSVKSVMAKNGIEFRQGSAGGGNQLRQPYLKGIVKAGEYKKFKVTEHIHRFGFYLGNHPFLKASDVKDICGILNGAKGEVVYEDEAV